MTSLAGAATVEMASQPSQAGTVEWEEQYVQRQTSPQLPEAEVGTAWHDQHPALDGKMPLNWVGTETGTPQRRAPTVFVLDAQVYQEVLDIFRAAAFETFEYGMESDFVAGLEALTGRFGSVVLAAIASIIMGGYAYPQVAAEALRWLGSVRDIETHQARLRLLERSLRSPSRWVRDGAAQGLDDLGDPHAVPHLRAAVDRELLPELRRDLEVALVQLQRFE